MLFVVRADGETLYGKSGSLPGDQLPTMLARALSHSGQILGDREMKLVATASQKFNDLKAKGDIEGAIKAVAKLKKLGTPGQIKSYATAVVELNEGVNELINGTIADLAKIQSDLEDIDQEVQLDAYLK